MLSNLSEIRTSATPVSVDNKHTTDYRYDANGERICKYSDLGETIYASGYYTETDGKKISKHIYIGSTRVASQVMSRTCETSTTMKRENTLYYHTDHLGSSGYVTDKKGEFYEHTEYTSSGESWVNEKVTGNANLPFKYTSKEQDAETGLYYHGARYYDAKLCRWISTDPILEKYLTGKPAGGVYDPSNLDLYSYVGNNPIVFIDPTGNNRIRYGFATIDEINQMQANGDFNGTVRVPIVDKANNITGFFNFLYDPNTGSSKYDSGQGKGLAIKQRTGDVAVYKSCVDEGPDDTTDSGGRFFLVEANLDKDVDFADAIGSAMQNKGIGAVTYFLNPKGKGLADSVKQMRKNGIRKDSRLFMYIYIDPNEETSGTDMAGGVLDANVFEQVIGEDGKTVNKYVGHEINNAVGKSYKEMMNENDKRK